MIRASAIASVGLGWLPLLTLPASALAMRSLLSPWAFMWLLAAAIYLGCKWQTWWQAAPEPRTVTGLGVGYLFAWPGMDAGRFLDSRAKVDSPRRRHWLWAIGKTVLGATLFWGAARVLLAYSDVLAGWAGMIGLIFLLHFGSFHLLALAWQCAGVDAQPIMRSPHRATSLAEFWGTRWNLGFRRLTHDLVFAPVSKRAGVSAAVFAAFLVSGLIHDAVISLPAGAGYGLPTAYFLLQGLGVAVERSRAGRRLGLGTGTRGRLFAVAVAALPAVLLFHPPFVHIVILPFMHAAGAL
jgi:hypothetical protein